MVAAPPSRMPADHPRPRVPPAPPAAAPEQPTAQDRLRAACAAGRPRRRRRHARPRPSCASPDASCSPRAARPCARPRRCSPLAAASGRWSPRPAAPAGWRCRLRRRPPGPHRAVPVQLQPDRRPGRRPCAPPCCAARGTAGSVVRGPRRRRPARRQRHRRGPRAEPPGRDRAGRPPAAPDAAALLPLAVDLLGTALLAGWSGCSARCCRRWSRCCRASLAVQSLLVVWALPTRLLDLAPARRDGALRPGCAGRPRPREEGAAVAADADQRAGPARARRPAPGAAELPWYAIIGPPGAGKTTALLNAGLSFPLAEQMGQAAWPASAAPGCATGGSPTTPC